jgi:NAD(P)-dependent dehydrogenase (short-subunit alcohol dehydrogenase family)
MAEHGGNIVMMDINEQLLIESAKEIADKYSVKTYPIVLDARYTTSVEEAMEKAYSQVDGDIEVLANCAGVSTSKLMLDVEDDEWDFVFNVNLRAVFTLSKIFAKKQIAKKKKGHIVTISSQASKIGEYGNGVYSISKCGVNMLTQVLGLELAEHNISVTAVCPGLVGTEMLEEVCQKRGPIEGMTPDEYKNHLTSNIPIGRLAEPSEIADLITFLASDRADYITGVTVTIAGGTTLI